MSSRVASWWSNNEPLGLRPTLDPLEQRVRTAAFGAIYTGEKPAPTRLADQLGVSETLLKAFRGSPAAISRP